MAIEKGTQASAANGGWVVHEIRIFRDSFGTLRASPRFTFAAPEDQINWINMLRDETIHVVCLGDTFDLPGRTRVQRALVDATAGSHTYDVWAGSQRAIGASSPEIIIE